MAVRREALLGGSVRRIGRKDLHMGDLGTPELMIVVIVGVMVVGAMLLVALLWTTLRR